MEDKALRDILQEIYNAATDNAANDRDQLRYIAGLASAAQILLEAKEQ